MHFAKCSETENHAGPRPRRTCVCVYKQLSHLPLLSSSLVAKMPLKITPCSQKAKAGSRRPRRVWELRTAPLTDQQQVAGSKNKGFSWLGERLELCGHNPLPRHRGRPEEGRCHPQPGQQHPGRKRISHRNTKAEHGRRRKGRRRRNKDALAPRRVGLAPASCKDQELAPR